MATASTSSSSSNGGSSSGFCLTGLFFRRSFHVIIIIIKHVLIKVTLSCQRHWRGTAQRLTSKKGRSADSRWPQADNSCSVVQLRSPNEDRTTTEKVVFQVTTERHQRR